MMKIKGLILKSKDQVSILILNNHLKDNKLNYKVMRKQNQEKDLTNPEIEGLKYKDLNPKYNLLQNQTKKLLKKKLISR